MSARIPPGFFESRLKFLVPGQDGEVIVSLGWEGTPPTSETIQNDFAENVEGIMGNLSEAISMTTIDFVIGQDGPDDIVFTLPVDFPGLAAGGMMPCNNAYLIQKRTETPGRRGRGRSYLPGVPEGAVDDAGQVAPASVDGINLNLSDMKDDMLTDDWVQQLLHASSPFAPSPVTTYLCQPLIATQRKRLRG
jgi:hypothetical protein